MIALLWAALVVILALLVAWGVWWGLSWLNCPDFPKKLITAAAFLLLVITYLGGLWPWPPRPWGAP